MKIEKVIQATISKMRVPKIDNDQIACKSYEMPCLSVINQINYGDPFDVLQVDAKGAKKGTKFKWQGKQRSVVNGAEPNQFAILTTDQKILLYAIQS